jgi:O-antigen ligase
MVYYARKKVLWPRLTLILPTIVIAVNLFLSEGRVGLITSFLLLTIFIFRYFWNRSRILTAASTTLFILVAFTFIKDNPRLSEENLRHEPRIAIWEIAVDQIVKSDFLGVGVSTAANNMTTEFTKRGMFNNKHTHNIFLQSTLEYGIIGLLTIFAIFILGFYSVSPNFKLIMTFLLMTTLLQLMMGSFERDLNPTLFLICFIMILHQDLADKIRLA